MNDIDETAQVSEEDMERLVNTLKDNELFVDPALRMFPWVPKKMNELTADEKNFMARQFKIMDWACSLSLPALFLKARGYRG